MMLTPLQIENAAQALFNAEKTGQQIGLLSCQYPDITMDDAYHIQSALIALKSADNKQIGWKIGLTSKAMQNALNIDIPDSGMLFDNMLFETGATIPKNRFIEPRIEAEIAFIMKSDVKEASAAAIYEATDYICPALEILDTRILRHDPKTGQARKVFDTISDNAANAGLVLGKEKHGLDESDLRWIGAIIKRNGSVEETGLGAAVLDNPITSMIWLAERLSHYNQRIKAGDIVLSGSFVRIIEAPSPSHFYADFSDFGSVEISFE